MTETYYLFTMRENDEETRFLYSDDLQFAIKQSAKDGITVHAYIQRSKHTAKSQIDRSGSKTMRKRFEWQSLTREQYESALKRAKEQDVHIAEIIREDFNTSVQEYFDEQNERKKRGESEITNEEIINTVARLDDYVWYRHFVEDDQGGEPA